MGLDSPSTIDAKPGSPEYRERIEESLNKMRLELDRIAAILPEFQTVGTRRDLVMRSLDSLRQVKDQEIVSAEFIQPSIDVLEQEKAQLDEQMEMFEHNLAVRELLKWAIATNENLLKEPTIVGIAGERPIWQGAREILMRSPARAMSAGEIAEQLVALGWTIDSKTPGEVVRTTLIRKARVFERVEGGKFRLLQAVSQGQSTATSSAGLVRHEEVEKTVEKSN
jgi:hypothetical protein